MLAAQADAEDQQAVKDEHHAQTDGEVHSPSPALKAQTQRDPDPKENERRERPDGAHGRLDAVLEAVLVRRFRIIHPLPQERGVHLLNIKISR